jgi:hypothetical protein
MYLLKIDVAYREWSVGGLVIVLMYTLDSQLLPGLGPPPEVIDTA